MVLDSLVQVLQFCDVAQVEHNALAVVVVDLVPLEGDQLQQVGYRRR